MKRNIFGLFDIRSVLKEKSCFLFGPRQTGKTTLIAEQLHEAQVFDLLDSDTFLRLSAKPSLLESETTNAPYVVIDEIQKCPSLLDHVHRLIERKKVRFLLTGSSARNLRKKRLSSGRCDRN